MTDARAREAAPLPRLIASDLDGTFLSPDGSVSEVNARAVQAAAAAGIPMVFATGRPIRWLDAITVLDGLHPIVIASNGAMVYDAEADTIMESLPIDAEVARAVVHELRDRLPEVAFGVEQGRRFGREPGYPFPGGTETPELFTGPVDELIDTGRFVKLLVKHDGLTCDALAATAASVIGDRLTVTHSANPATGLLEVSAPGVSKASTLAAYCRRLGIAAADVAAFGDQPNDLAMLSWAGHPHRMAVSHPLLLRLDMATAGSNADSGVGRTILGWLGG